MFKVHKDAKNAQSFQNIIAYFKYFSAVLYNFPIGYHKIALQELTDNQVINNMQQMLKMWKISIYMNRSKNNCCILTCMERSDTCMSLNPSSAHFLSQTLSREPETESRGVQEHYKQPGEERQSGGKANGETEPSRANKKICIKENNSSEEKENEEKNGIINEKKACKKKKKNHSTQGCAYEMIWLKGEKKQLWDKCGH